VAAELLDAMYLGRRDTVLYCTRAGLTGRALSLECWKNVSIVF
jgi:hypothetical protein